jgi:uncharacterized repeat protein (TIGR01451 family)
MHGQTRAFGLVRSGGTLLIVLFLLAAWFIQPVAGATPPEQEPRPTLPPPPPPVGPSGGSGGEGGEASVTADTCAGLRGTVINWGFQNEPGVTLRLSDGGWEATQISSSDGRYQFGPLGQGVAFLSPDLASSQAETLRPMANDIAIRLRCDFDVVANLGLYSSPVRPDPPAMLTMGVSQAALNPGGTVTFYLTLQNGMPHAISHVFVTDYLPQGLTVTEVTTSRGTVEVLNGRMVTIDVGDLLPDGTGTIQLTAQADPALAYGTRLQNTASLLYAESAADQAWAVLTIGNTGAMAVATPEAATPMPADESAASLPPTPAADQTPGPGDELLPVTGSGAALVAPVAGIILAIILLGARRLRGGHAGE